MSAGQDGARVGDGPGRGAAEEAEQAARVLVTADDAPAAAAPAPMTGSVVTSAGWSALGRLGSQGLQFLAGLVLARLLLPADFGLMAGVYVVTGFAVIFFDMGLTAALVHQRDEDEESLATAFWLNAIGGLLFVGLLWLAAPLVADFYGDDRLRALVPLSALSFTFSLGVSHVALLQRRMRFRLISLVELAAALIGNVVTVTAALAGLGAYALVTGPVVQSALMSVLFFGTVRWRPRHFITLRALRGLWGFTGGMIGFSLVNFVGRNIDTVLIGKVNGPSELGLYNRGYSLMLLPLQQVSQVVGRVMFPALASIRDDRERLQRAYRRAVTIMTALLCPVLVGMAATADGLVPLLWGPRWTATVPILQVLCLAGLPQCLSSSEGWLYQSQGRTNLMFLMGGISTAVGAAGVVVGLHWGALGVAWGVFTTAWGYQPFALHAACGTIGLRARRVVIDVAPTIGVAVVMGAVVWALPLALGASRSSLPILAWQVLLGCVLYGAGMLLFRRNVVDEVLRVVRRR